MPAAFLRMRRHSGGSRPSSSRALMAKMASPGRSPSASARLPPSTCNFPNLLPSFSSRFPEGEEGAAGR